jgi:TolB protein
MMNADGTGQEQLTNDGIEKRGPAWSPDGSRILFACRLGARNAAGVATFEICVMEVANRQITQLTVNAANDLTPTWSPDGEAIVSHRAPANQLWVMYADGSGQTQLTVPPGLNLLATSWGVIEVGRGKR